MEGWQYCTVWRQVAADAPFDLDEPPAGTGWVVNEDKAGGREVTVPVWSDGSVVFQRRYWRRPVAGMKPWMHDAQIDERRE